MGGEVAGNRDNDLAKVQAAIVRVQRDLEQKDLEPATREKLKQELALYAGMRSEIRKAPE